MTESDASATRLGRWESRTEWPLAAGAILFLVAYAWPILDRGLSAGVRNVCGTVTLTVWILFAVDYAARFALAPQRRTFVARNLVDLAAIVLPVLRPLRLLRLVALLSILNRRATASLRGRIALYVGGSSILLIFCASLAALDAERGHSGANIESFGDALWWSATTIFTVGYGDRYPVTTVGRFVAAGLMLGGIALLGVVTASIASWLIDRVREVEESADAVTRADVAALTAEVLELKRLIVAQGDMTVKISD